MTLYTVLRHEIGLKSDGSDAFDFFGIKTRLAEFHCFSIMSVLKNYMMDSVTSGPITDLKVVKNSAE